MKKLSSFFLLLLLGLHYFYFDLASVDAQSRRISSKEIVQTNVTFKFKGKNQNRKIFCLRKTPGSTSQKRKQLFFNSFSSQINLLKRIKRKNKAQTDNLNLLLALLKPAIKKCSELNSPPPPPPPPPPTAVPDHLSLEIYQGQFGLEQARTLYNRFAFSWTPEELSSAVSLGLDGAVERLLTRVNEPSLDAIFNDLSCDNWLANDPNAGTNNRSCNPLNPNDFDITGLKNALMYRFTHSKNQFFHRLALFIMDERLALSTDILTSSCQKHSVRTYVNAVYNSVYSGSYYDYVKRMNDSELMHGWWLDGASNDKGNPNENYAREFWELGTVGTTNLDGTPVYGDFDVAQASLAFTGLRNTNLNINGFNVCTVGFFSMFHDSGPKVVFAGSPYQAVVYSADDLLNATFRHPRLSEHLAEDIWKEFINLDAGPNEIQSLAKIIRDNNFNLIPVFKIIMKSKAVYAQKSKNSLIKHPISLLIGYLRQTGFPLYERNYDLITLELEQNVLNAPSVFGWDEKMLSAKIKNFNG